MAGVAFGRLEAGALASAGLVLATALGCRVHTEQASPAEQAPLAEQARVPELELPAHDGRMVTLEQLLERGPALLVFYRGHW